MRQSQQRPGLTKGTKVAVAMSGGVDSSAAVVLLQESGFEPVGVTLRLWVDGEAIRRGLSRQEEEGKGCTSLQGIEDAQKVARRLGIPHYVFDMQEDFLEKVVNHFLREYKSGRTPNPCIPCNRYLKFSLLMQRVRSLGIIFFATGHYVKNIYDPLSGKYSLCRGTDQSKDQSYMLYTLSQEQLAGLIFPLGELTKEEIRQKARDAALEVAEKKDSQEICFIPDNDYRSFLVRSGSEAILPGDILSVAGEKLGEHKGLPFYTVGQRKGLGLTSTEPLYVIDINPKSNALIVGHEDEIYSRGLTADDLNFIWGETPAEEMQVQVKIRYRAPSVPAILYPPEKGEAKIIFSQQQKAVTPGQAVVFYRGEEVVGGGTIKEYC